MKLIVAVDRNWGIGCGGELLAHIPGDLKYFKEKTTGGVVIMGRKTLESMPGKKGLPNRVNFVLTSREGYEAPGCITVNSDEELLSKLSEYDGDKVFVIGGESIYRKFYRMCDICYVTKMDADLGADRFMPNLDEDPLFTLTDESETHSENGIDYRFCTYRRAE